MGIRVAVLLTTLVLCLAGGCTKAQREALDRAMATPPVDLRAVAGGVEVGLVCGPGVPMWSELDETDSAGHQRTISHTAYTSAHLTRTVVVPVPLAMRRTRLTGAVALNWNPAQRGVPFGLYAFDFRYSDLPRNTVKRIAGGDCNR